MAVSLENAIVGAAGFLARLQLKAAIRAETTELLELFQPR
jgi:hypothetical protein